jgi:S1-C subfamily serine protease
MRWPLALITGLLLLLQTGYFLFLRDCACVSCGSADRSTSRCSDADSDHVNVASIEDQVLKSNLIRQGTSLIERGQTVEGSILAKQLGVTTCELELSPPGSSVSDQTELFRVAKDSVVVVGGLYKCNKCTRWHANTASGFVLTSSGAIVTNYHVIEASTERGLVVMTADSHVYPVRSILAASRADDLVILQVDAEGLQPLPLADSENAAPVGSTVSVISHPDGRFFCYTAGVVSRYMKIHAAGQTADAMAITADYARGSSGAPVLNHQGQVVAVVSSTESIYYTQDGQRQMNLQMVFRTCIPTSSLLRMLRPVNQVASRAP